MSEISDTAECELSTQKTVSIPPQLCNPSFRFIKVLANSKRPIEKNWQTTSNYSFNDPVLLKHLEAGGNYGVICGPGGLRVFDADELERLSILGIISRLPKTFAVESRKGHIHHYFIIPELDKKRILYDPVLKDGNGHPAHLGELQGPGTQVVGPGSIHPSTGEPYRVVQDLPIVALTLDEMEEALEGLIATSPQRPEIGAAMVKVEDDLLRTIPIESIAYPGHPHRLGDEIQGAHPIHGSTTGKNFRIDPSKNSWYCDRCQSGGGPALWLAVKYGILQCREAQAGALRGEDFKQVVMKAQAEGLIPKVFDYKHQDGEGLILDDVAEVTQIKVGPNKGQNKIRFSPDKAAESICQYLDLVSTPDGTIWHYKDGIYHLDGEFVVDQLLDQVAGDFFSIKQSQEVHRKIILRTKADESIFDADPYKLCVKNGVVDLLTGELLEHSPTYYMRLKCPVVFNPRARCPEFLRFLDTACSNDTDRVTLIDWMVACAILLEFEYVLFLLGHGSNGKHVYESVLLALFGEECAEAISLEELINSRFALSNLKGSRFCIGTETNVNGPKTEILKRISGGDWLSADVKNRGRVRFKCFTQLMFDTNSMPVFEDASYGFVRRFTRVNMPYRFVEDPDPNDPLQKKRDTHLIEKLTTEAELSGILNVIVARASQIARDRVIHRRENDYDSYEKQSFSGREFIDSFIEFRPEHRFSMDWQIPAADLYAKFEEYCKYVVGAKISRSKFSAILGKENAESSRTIRYKGVPVRGFRGMRFDQEAFEAFMDVQKQLYQRNGVPTLVRQGNDGQTSFRDSNPTTVTLSSSILKEIKERYSSVYRESLEGRLAAPHRYIAPNDTDSGSTDETGGKA